MKGNAMNTPGLAEIARGGFLAGSQLASPLLRALLEREVSGSGAATA